ncbi:DUF6777 domain-containing protein [Prescottella defluvii]|uniref:DUF6777 domain-containing protein n=1 Tax=Prescottella defluvii TaxID=1323361 RepID=UPI0012DFEE23|nr:DUF6777 domain-containing protein [Prescottella defluvii]
MATTSGATERADQVPQDRTTVSGEEAGLYGGSLDVSVCDREKLSNFLEANPAQDRAFKSVVQADDVRSYVNSLSPVVLTRDTRVTNNGFENNAAAPFQSVLQTGTAVLIDNRGVPRVRCACGNPLAEPTAAKPEYTGPRWKNFDEGQVVTVAPAAEPMSSTQLSPLNASGPSTTIVIGESTPLEVVPPDGSPSPEGGVTSGGGVTGEGGDPENQKPQGRTGNPIQPGEPTTADKVPGVTAPDTATPPTE